MIEYIVLGSIGLEIFETKRESLIHFNLLSG